MAGLLGKGLVYTSILALLVMFVASGFMVAQNGIQSMVGGEVGPKTVGVIPKVNTADVKAISQKVMGANVTWGDQLSRQLDSSKSVVGPIMDQIALDSGKLIQSISSWIVSAIGEQMDRLMKYVL